MVVIPVTGALEAGLLFDEKVITYGTDGGQTVATVIVFKRSGQVQGTITITYDGSGNAIRMVRT